MSTQTRSPDWDGYGEQWDVHRKSALKRDNYTCQRCFADDVTLQAHHIVPRSQGGSDNVENLITLCRPWHGVQHPNNSAFDGARSKAPIFPNPRAPNPVDRLSHPSYHSCNRCGKTRLNSSEVFAYRQPPGDIVSLCFPCAGVVLEADPEAEQSMRAQHSVRHSQLQQAHTDAPYSSKASAHSAVSYYGTPDSRLDKLHARTRELSQFRQLAIWLVSSLAPASVSTFLFATWTLLPALLIGVAILLLVGWTQY